MVEKILDRELTEAETNYVLFHLSHHIETDMSLNYLIGYHTTPKENFKGIEIYKSDKGIDLEAIDINDGIPLLFPGIRDENIFQTEGKKFIIKHDLIKASFYLLSAYQEYENDDLDKYGRFKWENSIQYKLKCTEKPLVNYYFDWLIEAISLYCKANNIGFERKNPLGKATLHLTHDIDLLRYFEPKKILYRWAQVVGLRPCDTDKNKLIKAAFKSTFKYLGINKMDNPYWSFGRIINTERYYGFKSTWFFLPKDACEFNADYNLEDEDVVNIINKIIKLQNDVGLHIPFKTRDSDKIKEKLEYLKKVNKASKKISRAHFLKYNIEKSPKDYYLSGIETDCSFGYSTCEGFRNSYCFPFMPFDHKKQEIIHILEIPLTLMDTTTLVHKKMTYDEIFNSTEILLEEVRKFGGVFSLLWHNTTFDETYNPNIVMFYEQLHHFFSQYNMQSLTTSEISDKMQSLIYK